MLKKQYYSYSLLVPGMLIFTVFFLVPALMSFYFAFSNWDASFTVTRHVGFVIFKTRVENVESVVGF